MLFQINSNVQNILYMKNCVHAKPQEDFFKKQKRKVEWITNA